MPAYALTSALLKIVLLLVVVFYLGKVGKRVSIRRDRRFLLGIDGRTKIPPYLCYRLIVYFSFFFFFHSLGVEEKYYA